MCACEVRELAVVHRNNIERRGIDVDVDLPCCYRSEPSSTSTLLVKMARRDLNMAKTNRFSFPERMALLFLVTSIIKDCVRALVVPLCDPYTQGAYLM